MRPILFLYFSPGSWYNFLYKCEEGAGMQINYASEDFEKAFTYHGNDLGAVWSRNCTRFRVWAPTARSASVRIYRSGTEGADDLYAEYAMSPSDNGTWYCALDGDWNGFYYTYLITLSGKTAEVCDPYARSAGVNGGRGMILDLSGTDPEGWDHDRDPNAGISITDAVIYELHIRDLSADSHSGIIRKGKYLGLAETGTKTRSGLPTGLDHIRSLGITHLHLLPVYDFGSVDESKPEKPQYNWGYDPVNYNVPEGSYSTDAYHGEVRVRELKTMIKALHDNGISVVMDVVYNHVYHTGQFCINRIVPGYFSRFDEKGSFSNGSGCGNDTATERSMVRKYIVDSVNYWSDEYHIDGFRFDLVGLIDTVTINEIMTTVHRKHPNVIFYGEGWDMHTGLAKPGLKLTTQSNSALVPGFAFFNDTLRDAVRGSVFDVNTLGFVSGNPNCKDLIDRCFLANPGWTDEPAQIINYISCHDNHTLYDRLAAALPKAPREDLIRRANLGAAINLLCPGVSFFQAGEELLRTKIGRNGERIHNSYRSSDRVNALKWEHLNDPETQKTLKYYKGLIRLRKAIPELRCADAASLSGIIEKVPVSDPHAAVYMVYGKERRYLIAFNAGASELQLHLPDGKWVVYLRNGAVSEVSPESIHDSVSVAPISALVLGQTRIRQ